jgi:hypothetical protein
VLVEGANSNTIFDPGGAIGATAADSAPGDHDIVERILRMLRDDPLSISDHWAAAEDDVMPTGDGLPQDLHYDPATDPRSTAEVDAEVDEYLADFKADPIRDRVPLRTMDTYMPAILAAGARIRQHGFDAVLDQAIAVQMQRGCQPDVIAALGEGYPHLGAVLRLKTEGLHYHMQPGFRPNGGDGFQQSRSYFRTRAVLHHSLTSMLSKGRAIAFPLDALSPDELASIHFS